MHATPPMSALHRAPNAAPRRSTDAPTRMFHWLFALSFAGAYLTAESESWRLVHVTLGYALGGLLAWRVFYGLVGPRSVRLGTLWRKVGGLPAWLRTFKAAPGELRSHARQGQHLVMALAIAGMGLLVIPLVLSGHAQFNDWGGDVAKDALEELHEFFGNAFLALVLVHVGLIALMSLLRRQNMARPMLSGRLDGHGPSPVQANRAWLAGLIVLAWLAWGAWQWHSAPQGLLAPPAAEHRGSAGHDEDD